MKYLLQGIKLGERVEFERSKENPRNILTLFLKTSHREEIPTSWLRKIALVKKYLEFI